MDLSGLAYRGEGPGGLRQLKDGAVKPFVTPNFDGTKASQLGRMMFDHDGNLWVGTVGRVFFVSMEMRWSIMGIRMGCPAIPCRLFLKTAKASSGPELRAESTAFAIRLCHVLEAEGLGRTYQRASWPAEMARSGSQTPARLIRLLTATSHPFAAGKGLPGEQVTRITGRPRRESVDGGG